MTRLILQLAIAITLFVGGIVAGVAWHARRVRTSQATQQPITQGSDEKPWPLDKQIVARSLQTHSFRTNKLRTNSDADVVWRWLKDSIAKYPQNWVKLNITDKETYGVVLYPPKTLNSMELTQYNEELSEKGLATLIEGKRYLPVEIFEGDIECPNWYGLIDADEAKLVYFVGRSA
jgi:hypothetical protein